MVAQYNFAQATNESYYEITSFMVQIYDYCMVY